MTASSQDPTAVDRRIVAKQMAATFPLRRIGLSNVSAQLRPLERTDLAQLVQILAGDPDMTWTRNEWDNSNVQYLLDLRLKHYEDYGFGVYGIEDHSTTRLIGMAGAQFFDEATSDVEVIAYIDRKLWNQGLATKILKEMTTMVFDNCDAVRRIVAATRHDNVAAQAVVRSLGMQPTGEGTHYGAPSIYWAVERDQSPD